VDGGQRRGAWTGAIGLWAGFLGVLPHVLHHLLPVVGGALLTGAVGGIVFGIIGFAAMVPFLLTLRRRFGTWTAPLVAAGVFGVVFLISTVFIGPVVRSALTGVASPEPSHRAHPSGHAP